MQGFYQRHDSGLNAWIGQRLEYAPHFHDDIEIVIMLEGKCRATVDSVEYLIEPGDLFITFPNQVHQYFRLGEEKYYIFVVYPNAIPEFKNLLYENLPESALVKGFANEAVIDLCKNIVGEEERSDEYSRIASTGYTYSLMAQIARKTKLVKSKSLGNFSTDILKNVLFYCSQNYLSDIRLSDVAENLHVSKFHVSRIFSEKLKVNFNDYINSLRINYACKLIALEEIPMTVVAERVGFNTVRSFNRAFAKSMGMTPREYKKNRK